MPRTIDTTVKTAAAASVVRPVLMVEMDFAGGKQYVTNAPFDIVFDSNTYLGVGDLGSINNITEVSDIEATNLSLTLSGVKPNWISLALTEDFQGRLVTIYMALLDDQHVVIDNPFKLWEGRMDTMSVVLDKESTVSLNCESRLADLFRAKVFRLNNATQRDLYTGDIGLQYIESMIEKEIVWQVKNL